MVQKINDFYQFIKNSSICLVTVTVSIFYIFAIYYYAESKSMVEYVKALYREPIHMDGFFQTYNGLSRLSRGEEMGKDFFVYLGSGLYYLLFIFYKIFGSDFKASGLAAQFLINLLPLIISLIILLSRGFRGYLLMALVTSSSLILLSIGDFNSGASLRLLRDLPSYIPALLFAIFYNKSLDKRLIILSFSVGALFTFSSASSISAIMAYGLFCATILVHYFRNNLIKQSLIIGSYFLLGLLLTPIILYGFKDSIEIIKYNFIDIASNQSWFFSFDLKPKSFMDVFWDFSGMLIVLIYFFYSYSRSFIKGNINNLLLMTVSLSLVITGLTSITQGKYFMGYFSGFSIFTYSCIFVALMEFVIKKIVTYKVSISIINIITIVIVLFSYFSSYRQYNDAKNKFAVDGKLFLSKDLNNYLFKTDKGMIKYINNNKHAKFLEEYSSIPSIINLENQETQVDSVIHALGSQREKFRKSLQELDDLAIVTSTNPSNSRWFYWNILQSWYFYKELFINYHIDYISPNLFFWKKKRKANIVQQVQCLIDNDKIIINNDKPGFYGVSLKYNFLDEFSILPTLLFADVDIIHSSKIKLSIPPRTGIHEFPTNKSTISFYSKPESKIDNLQLISCIAHDYTKLYKENIINNRERKCIAPVM